jgi:hypothetical protein
MLMRRGERNTPLVNCWRGERLASLLDAWPETLRWIGCCILWERYLLIQSGIPLRYLFFGCCHPWGRVCGKTLRFCWRVALRFFVLEPGVSGALLLLRSATAGVPLFPARARCPLWVQRMAADCSAADCSAPAHAGAMQTWRPSLGCRRAGAGPPRPSALVSVNTIFCRFRSDCYQRPARGWRGCGGLSPPLPCRCLPRTSPCAPPTTALC